MRGEPEVNNEEHPDAASGAAPCPERTDVAPASRLRGWRRNVLLALVGLLALPLAAAVWLALDPGGLRSAVQYAATAATGRPVAIGALDFRLEEGRAVIEARGVQVGQTTTQRVAISLTGLQWHANGDGVRFPNGSAVEHFRATIDLSPISRPRISAVDANGAVLVVARRVPPDSAGPPPLARLLVVPRLLLRLGLERLVLHSGEIEYRGRSLTQSAGVTAVIDATGEGLMFRGELLIGPRVPPLPFEGSVRNPMADDWRLDVRLSGDRVPMEGVRFLAGVLEPNPTVQATLRRISNEARFGLSVRIARARIESTTLDLAFDAPDEAAELGISLEGVRFLADAVPGPAGWTVTGEVDWSRLPGGADAERSPFSIRWSTGIPESLRWSARRVAVPILAPLVRDALPSGQSLRPALERLHPVGMIDEVAVFGDPGASGEPSFWLSAVLSGFGATVGEWRISEAGARIDRVGDEWRVRFVDDRLHAAIPAFRSAPYELTLKGEVRVDAAEDGWAAHTEGVEFTAGRITGRVEGSFAASFVEEEHAAALDAEIRLDDVALADIAAVLPDRRAAAFTRWYRRAVRSGRLTGSTVRIRGDPRRVPFPDGDGDFEAKGTVSGVEFAYAQGWPAVQVRVAELRANGSVLEFSDIRGSIFDSAIEDGFARFPDTTDQAGRVRVSLAGSGPAEDLLTFVRASPLRTPSGGPATDLRAEGPASMTAELDIPYGRDAAGRPLDVSGTIELEGVDLRIDGRRAVLEGVRGGLAFDAASLSGGPLRGRFRGAGIDTRVNFDHDEGLVLRFSGTGNGAWFGIALEDLLGLAREESDPWLTRLRGRTSWDAEYRARDGIVFRSDLRGTSVEFPPPFEKPAGTARPLEVVLTPGETEWRLDAHWGTDAKGAFEIARTGDEWGLARAGIVLGGGEPALPAEDHVEVSGTLAEIGLDPWLTHGGGSSLDPAGWLSRIGRVSLRLAGARVFDRRVSLRHLEFAPSADGSEFHFRLAGEGVAGDVRYPVDPASGQALLRFERLHLGEAVAAGEDAEGEPPDAASDNTGVRPDRWPSFDARIGSFRFGKIDLGTVRATGRRTENGFHIEDLRTDSPDFQMRGRGSWLAGGDGVSVSRIEARLKTGNPARFLSTAGLAEGAMPKGPVEVRFELAWPGSPFEPALEKIEGVAAIDAENGRLPQVDAGPIGRLFSLLSLDALPRVLALDLSHVVGKGFAYDRFAARAQVEDGKADIREFTISGPSARIDVSGSLDLTARRYDQEITVIPRLTRSGALLPVWAVVWPALVANFLLEKTAGDDEIILDQLFRLRYRLRGPLDDPQIERIDAREK